MVHSSPSTPREVPSLPVAQGPAQARAHQERDMGGKWGGEKARSRARKLLTWRRTKGLGAYWGEGKWPREWRCSHGAFPHFPFPHGCPLRRHLLPLSLWPKPGPCVTHTPLQQAAGACLKGRPEPRPWQSLLLPYCLPPAPFLWWGPTANTAATLPSPLGELGLRRLKGKRKIQRAPKCRWKEAARNTWGTPGERAPGREGGIRGGCKRKPHGSQGGPVALLCAHPNTHPYFTQPTPTETLLLLDHLFIYSPEPHRTVLTCCSTRTGKKGERKGETSKMHLFPLPSSQPPLKPSIKWFSCFEGKQIKMVS